MSTIDPVQARRARAERRIGSPRTLAALWTAGAALFVLGALLGFGLIAERNSGRQMALGIRDFDAEPWINDAWYALPAAFVLLLGALPLYFLVYANLIGDPRPLPPVDPFTIALAGTTVGLLAFSGLWSQPQHVGFTRDEHFATVDTWSSSAWASYWLPLWLPALAAALTVVAFVTCTLLRRRSSRRGDAVRRMLTAGRPVPGTITEGVAISPGTRTIASWHFTYTDAQGVQRWVKRTNAFEWQNAPKPGQRVWVLFDPARPGDTSRIFVSRVSPDRAEDYA
ncbi:DUF3592 domain-containing protein [Pseudoclavibacter sp. RFBB5]|uniref:DUF3592 domain-containing protein n=1 Tax=Pseudoclavibacter sp. RFBB5 TaxID=2080574 RepID=UPI000CE8B68E|nr:DUF3592 domain-containing protein [Pseudoclavibacter sp. RFBB5]PPG33434.1 hypothetical protein C5B97_02155 [Pseudoclavibacter sp. RFBB5]